MLTGSPLYSQRLISAGFAGVESRYSAYLWRISAVRKHYFAYIWHQKRKNAWYKRWNSATHTRHTAEKVPYISHLVKTNPSNLSQISRIDILAETSLPVYDAPLSTTAISKARFPRHARMEYASTRNTHGMHLFSATAALFFAPMHFCYGS